MNVRRRSLHAGFPNSTLRHEPAPPSPSPTTSDPGPVNNTRELPLAGTLFTQTRQMASVFT